MTTFDANHAARESLERHDNDARKIGQRHKLKDRRHRANERRSHADDVAQARNRARHNECGAAHAAKQALVLQRACGVECGVHVARRAVAHEAALKIDELRKRNQRARRYVNKRLCDTLDQQWRARECRGAHLADLEQLANQTHRFDSQLSPPRVVCRIAAPEEQSCHSSARTWLPPTP